MIISTLKMSWLTMLNLCKMILEKLGKLLLLIFLLLAGKTFACVCIPPKFTEKYTQSDFVAVAKIIKVYRNESEEEVYKADILIKDLFKGENLTSIYIEGRSDGKRGSSCNIFIPESTELIIYARKKTNNQFSFSACSGYLILNQEAPSQKRTAKREIEMLNILKAKNIDFTNKTRFIRKRSFSEELEKFKGIQLSKHYALYQVTFTSGFATKSVELLSGFGNEIDNALTEILKKADWLNLDVKSENLISKDTLSDESKFLVGFYYYPEEKEYKSFVSEYDL
jgi:hypothetical protein